MHSCSTLVVCDTSHVLHVYLVQYIQQTCSYHSLSHTHHGHINIHTLMHAHTYTHTHTHTHTHTTWTHEQTHPVFPLQHHTFSSIIFLVTNPAKFSETMSCNTNRCMACHTPNGPPHALSQTDTLHTAAWSVR